MHRHIATAIIATLLCVTPSYGVLIDNFQTPQSLQVTNDLDLNQVAGPGILTGWRDISAVVATGSSIYVEAADGVLTATFNPGGAFGVVWDGPRLTTPFLPDFFGPMDLTDGGASNALTFTVLFADQPADVRFEIWHGDRFEWTAVSVPGGITSPQAFIIPFTEFTGVFGPPLDYSNVSAVTNITNFYLPASVAGTLQFGTIETVFVAEPSSAALACLGLAGICWCRRVTSALHRPHITSRLQARRSGESFTRRACERDRRGPGSTRSRRTSA